MKKSWIDVIVNVGEVLPQIITTKESIKQVGIICPALDNKTKVIRVFDPNEVKKHTVSIYPNVFFTQQLNGNTPAELTLILVPLKDHSKDGHFYPLPSFSYNADSVLHANSINELRQIYGELLGVVENIKEPKNGVVGLNNGGWDTKEFEKKSKATKNALDNRDLEKPEADLKAAKEQLKDLVNLLNEGIDKANKTVLHPSKAPTLDISELNFDDLEVDTLILEQDAKEILNDVAHKWSGWLWISTPTINPLPHDILDLKPRHNTAVFLDLKKEGVACAMAGLHFNFSVSNYFTSFIYKTLNNITTGPPVESNNSLEENHVNTAIDLDGIRVFSFNHFADGMPLNMLYQEKLIANKIKMEMASFLASGTIYYNASGFMQIRNKLFEVGHQLEKLNILDNFNIDKFPRPQEMDTKDRANGFIRNIQVSFSILGQVRFLALTLETKLGG